MLCPCHGLSICRVSDTGHNLLQSSSGTVLGQNIACFLRPVYTFIWTEWDIVNLILAIPCRCLILRIAIRFQENAILLHGIQNPFCSAGRPFGPACTGRLPPAIRSKAPASGTHLHTLPSGLKQFSRRTRPPNRIPSLPDPKNRRSPPATHKSLDISVRSRRCGSSPLQDNSTGLPSIGCRTSFPACTALISASTTL